MSAALKRVETFVAAYGEAWSDDHVAAFVDATELTVADLRAVLALAAAQRHITKQYGRALTRFISLADHAHVESLLEGAPDSFAGRLRVRVLLDLRKPLPKTRRTKP